MRARVEKTAATRRDLIKLAIYLGEQRPALANRFLQAAERAFQRLAKNPSLAARAELRNPRYFDVRVWPIRGFPNHLIFLPPD